MQITRMGAAARALNSLCIAGWVRSLRLPVPYSSSHDADLFAYAAARALKGCVSQVGSRVATASVPYSSSHDDDLFARAAPRALNGLCIVGWVRSLSRF
jgi:hypothetical protein